MKRSIAGTWLTFVVGIVLGLSLGVGAVVWAGKTHVEAPGAGLPWKDARLLAEVGRPAEAVGGGRPWAPGRRAGPWGARRGARGTRAGPTLWSGGGGIAWVQRMRWTGDAGNKKSAGGRVSIMPLDAAVPGGVFSGESSLSATFGFHEHCIIPGQYSCHRGQRHWLRRRRLPAVSAVMNSLGVLQNVSIRRAALQNDRRRGFQR